MMETQKTQPFFHMGDDAIVALVRLVQSLRPSSVFVLTDSNTKTACLPILQDTWPQDIVLNSLSFKAGESSKTLVTCAQLWQELTDAGADRRSLLINIGGGVTTDMGGFVAATFKRGIPFIQVPTSLLAMVDASSGGKTGIDFNGAKNQIGTFTEPNGIFVYPNFLKSLPESELISGWAEVLKHGLIADRDYWNMCKRGIDSVDIDKVIERSIAIKTTFVAADLREAGTRKTLNFGHTLGHALESLFLQKDAPVKHGQAVAVGMVMASKLSTTLTGLSHSELDEIGAIMLSAFENLKFAETDIPAILELLKHDKKNFAGSLQFVLLKAIGVPVLDIPVTEEQVVEVLKWYLKKTAV